MEILKKTTKSLCEECLQEIPAKIVLNEGKVFIKKICPIHGKKESIVEKDYDCYRRFAHFTENPKIDDYDSLVVNITYKCNASCSFCYVPYRDRKDITLKNFEEILSRFEGATIVLSGGEPTLREDLPQFIQMVIKHKKFPVLQTNGVKLADIQYVRKLKKAGLCRVHFSFDGFDPKVYKVIKGSELFLEKKLKALEHLKDERILTIIGTTIYKGVNEDQIQKIVQYIVNKGPHIYQLRLRSCAEVGQYKENIPNYFLSEMFDLFAKAMNTSRTDLYKYFLCHHSDHSPHHVDLKMYFRAKGSKIFPMPRMSKLINMIYLTIYKFLIWSKLYDHLDKLVWAIPERHKYFAKINVRIIVWPTIKNIDLNEVNRGIAHLYDNKIINFCHAVVLNQKL